MKKVKAIVSFAGLQYSASKGQVFTCSDGVAEKLIRAKRVVLEEDLNEVAIPEQPKKATRKKTTKK